MSQSEIDHQVSEAEYWFKVELQTPGPLPDGLKISICREILKCGRDSNRLEIKIALLSLVLAGQVSNPLSFSATDIENALWLVRNNKFGFDPQAPISLV
ncbi:hypothetical protein [Pseudomonas phoenicis]|uniref:hypothetical protein n=1 Tax=unclassified Pseudomonas TaxID=196821 RepID=UPI0039A1F666